MAWNEDMRIEDAVIIKSVDRAAVIYIILGCTVFLGLFLWLVA